MGNTTGSLPWSAVDETRFRTVGQFLNSALTAAGLTRVAASSVATNWSTTIAGYSAAANQSAAAGGTDIAWEVWQFSTADSASPLFIRIGYGTYTSTSMFRLTFQLAQSAGSGGVVTPIGGSPHVTVHGQIPSNSTAATAWAAGDGHGFVVATRVDASGMFWFAVDRYRNLDGTLDSTNVMLFAGSTAASPTAIYNYDLTANEYTSSTLAPCVTLPGGIGQFASNLNENNESTLYPWWGFTKNGMGVSKMVASYCRNDIGYGATRTAEWLPSEPPSPTTRTVKVLGAANTGGFDALASTSTGVGLAIWWSD